MDDLNSKKIIKIEDIGKEIILFGDGINQTNGKDDFNKEFIQYLENALNEQVQNKSNKGITAICFKSLYKEISEKTSLQKEFLSKNIKLDDYLYKIIINSIEDVLSSNSKIRIEFLRETDYDKICKTMKTFLGEVKNINNLIKICEEYMDVLDINDFGN